MIFRRKIVALVYDSAANSKHTTIKCDLEKIWSDFVLLVLMIFLSLITKLWTVLWGSEKVLAGEENVAVFELLHKGYKVAYVARMFGLRFS